MNRYKILLAFFLALIPAAAFAQGPVTISRQSYVVDFPNKIEFQVEASAPTEITEITLVVRFPESTTRIPVKVTPGTRVQGTANWSLRADVFGLAGGYLPPGAEGEYFWVIKDAAGEVVETEPQPLRVDDNRFSWEKIENDRVAIYTYGSSVPFARQVFDKANASLQALEESLGVKMDKKLQVYLWDTHADYLSATANHPEWSGGTIDETFGIVLMNGGDRDFALVATPHELTHLVLHKAVGKGLGGYALPRWLDEGLATYYEAVPPRLEARFESVLRRAISTDRLHRLRAIEGGFTNLQGSDVDLAYAQSYAVTDFMLRTYGQEKMRQLLSLFRQGEATDDALEQVYGVDTDGLENLWRQSVGLPPKDYPKREVATPGAVPTMALSSAETPKPKTTPISGGGSSQQSPSATPLSVSAAATPAVQATPAAAGGSAGPASGLCGGLVGGAAFAMIGAYHWQRRRVRPPR